ncbi:MAG TPA: hypothetical protein VFV05_25775 [Methylomirabilota bacterium]|nr:hypothetical protein [Methylomirabilota bacterium]
MRVLPTDLRQGCRRAELVGAAIGPTLDASTVTGRLFNESVIELALSEAIAVYGLILFLLGGRRLDFYGFPGRAGA